MSVMHCSGCDNYIDTDFDVEGVWEDGGTHRFWCSRCLERAIEAKEPDCEILAAYKKQDPAGYAEAMDDGDTVDAGGIAHAPPKFGGPDAG